MANIAKTGIFLLISMFMVSFAAAAVTVDQVSISPSNPGDNDILDCSFTVSGDQSNYEVDVTWEVDGSTHAGDDESITASDSTTTSTSTAGDIESADTTIGQNWVCRVTAEDGFGNSSARSSVSVTIGGGNKLAVKDIKAKCSPKCDDDDLDEDSANNGDAGTIMEVRPGSDLELTFEVENLWPDNVRDHDIDNSEIECDLEDIGDEDNQEENIDFKDMDPGEDSGKETMDFIIPNDAEDGEVYQMDCILTGEDQDGTDYELDFTVDVEVEKQDHEVVFDRAQVSPSTLTCNKRVTVDYQVKNIGGRDEDDVEVVIRNDELDIWETDFISELQEGDFDDDDTEFSNTYSFLIGDDVGTGTYSLRMEVFFDDGDESTIQLLDLIVGECQADEPEEEEEEEEEPVVVVQQPPVVPTQTPTPVTAEPATKTEDSIVFTDSVWFIVLLAAAVIVLLAIAIWMVSVAVRK